MESLVRQVKCGLDDSDTDDDTQWSYVWPKELVRRFLKINNQSSPIAEKYVEYRLKPLESIQKEIDNAKVNLFYAQRTGTDGEVMERISELKKLEGKYDQEEEKAEDRIFKHLNNDEELVDQMIDLHGQTIQKGIHRALE